MLRCDAAVAPVFRNQYRPGTGCSRGSRRPARRFLARHSRPCAPPLSQLWERNHRGHIARKHSDPRTDRSLVTTIGGGGRQNRRAVLPTPAVSSNALSGLDPDEAFDTSAIAAELHRALAAAAFSADIAPKISITLDGGGALHLDAVAADVRMRAEVGGHTCLHVAVAGDAESATPLGAITTEHAVEAAVAIVRAIAAAKPATARARDILAANGAAAFRGAIAGRLVDLPLRPPAAAAGRADRRARASRRQCRNRPRPVPSDIRLCERARGACAHGGCFRRRGFPHRSTWQCADDRGTSAT